MKILKIKPHVTVLQNFLILLFTNCKCMDLMEKLFFYDSSDIDNVCSVAVRHEINVPYQELIFCIKVKWNTLRDIVASSRPWSRNKTRFYEICWFLGTAELFHTVPFIKHNTPIQIDIFRACKLNLTLLLLYDYKLYKKSLLHLFI